MRALLTILVLISTTSYALDTEIVMDKTLPKDHVYSTYHCDKGGWQPEVKRISGHGVRIIRVSSIEHIKYEVFKIDNDGTPELHNTCNNIETFF